MEQLNEAGSDYLLEIGMEELHKESRVWMSRIELWKRELDFFQKLLDTNSLKFSSKEDKKKESHFQNLIFYYNGELLDEYKQSVRRHEKRLAQMLESGETLNEVTYRNRHIELKDKVDSFDDTFRKYKHEFYKLIEEVI